MLDGKKRATNTATDTTPGDGHNTKSMAFENVWKQKAFEIRGPSKGTLIFETSAMHRGRIPQALLENPLLKNPLLESPQLKNPLLNKRYWKLRH